MFVACWSVKGGSGTTVVSASLALAVAAAGTEVLLVDLSGDLPAALGMAEPDGPGVADWLAAAAEVTGDALARLEVDAGPGLSLLPMGTTIPDAPERAEELAAVLADDGRTVVVDCGVVADGGASQTSLALATGAGLSLLVLRPCYLALRRALKAPIEASGVVLVGEPQRALQQADVEDVLGLRVRGAIPWKPAIATAVDAGLLGRRLPSALERALGELTEMVAA
jgi:MinD-like ATPase involved in chromosome partitioning or flagellar assembly